MTVDIITHCVLELSLTELCYLCMKKCPFKFWSQCLGDSTLRAGMLLGPWVLEMETTEGTQIIYGKSLMVRPAE